MADAYQCLASLRNLLHKRREEFKERLARGLSADDSYAQMVGRCKELADSIDIVNQQIKSVNGGNDDAT
jgi:NADH:ubiquinone oxidoreductase subunit D